MTLVDTDGGPSITPTFSSFSACSDAVTEARINAGFHFRTACDVAQNIGYAVADQLVRNALLPLPGSGLANLSVRGRTGGDDETLIAGFVVGAGSRQVLVAVSDPRSPTLLTMFPAFSRIPCSRSSMRRSNRSTRATTGAKLVTRL